MNYLLIHKKFIYDAYKLDYIFMIISLKRLNIIIFHCLVFRELRNNILQYIILSEKLNFLY